VDWGTFSPGLRLGDFREARAGGLVSCDSRADLSEVELDRFQAVEITLRTTPKLKVQEGDRQGERSGLGGGCGGRGLGDLMWTGPPGDHLGVSLPDLGRVKHGGWEVVVDEKQLLAMGCECWRFMARNQIRGGVDWGTFLG
jgi:hypothetical protein